MKELMTPTQRVKKTFERPGNQDSTAQACLSSIVNYYGGEMQSGKLSSSEEPTIIDLYWAATAEGFEPEACKGDVATLKENDQPVILQLFGGDSYYAVCYGFHEKFLIGDPGWGLVEYSDVELKALWPSGLLLRLTPNQNFVTRSARRTRSNQWLRNVFFPHRAQWIINLVLCFLLGAFFVLATHSLHQLVAKVLAEEAAKQLLWPFGYFLLFVFFFIVLHYAYRSLTELQVKNNSDRFFSYVTRRFVLRKRSLNTRSQSSNELLQLMKSQYELASVVYRSAWMVSVFLASCALLFVYSAKLGGVALLLAGGFFLQNQRPNLSAVKGEQVIGQLLNEALIKISLVLSVSKKEELVDDLTEQYTLLSYESGNASQQQAKKSFLRSIVALLTAASMLLMIYYLYSLGEYRIATGIILIPLTAVFSCLVYQLVSNYHLAEKYLISMNESYADQLESNYPSLNNRQMRSSFDTFTLKNVSVRHSTLKDINVSLSSGELFMFWGPTGIGKNAFFQALKKKESLLGAVSFNHQDWRKMPLAVWHDHASFVDEDIYLFNGTLAENIMLGRQQQEVEEFLKFCEEHNIHQLLTSFPKGYVTVINKAEANLSKAQIQLIGLIRALYQQPKLLFLYEPTAYFDSDTEALFFQLLHRMKDQTSIVVFTGKSQLLHYADRVYSFSNAANVRSAA